MRKAIFIVLLFSVFLTAGDLLAENVQYVQSVKAKVMSGPSFKSVVIGYVGKGHKFEVLGKDRSWIKVKYDFQQGYVSSLLLSSQPPMTKVAFIKSDDEDIKQGVRRRASTYTSAAAARGLTADDRRRLSRDEKIDYESLEKIESFTLSEAEIARFTEAAK